MIADNFQGQVNLPVSGQKRDFNGNDKWLDQLSQKDYFAVRLGVLKFRGWIPKNMPIQFSKDKGLSDEDFTPKFEQKGVDMRIGLDMAIFSENKIVDSVTLITNDTDCVPAMKHARRSGLQISLIVVPDCNPAPELIAHSDFVRSIAWPGS